MTIQPAAELERLHKAAAPDFAAGLRSYARALLEKRKPDAARDELYRLLVTAQTKADLLARAGVHRYRRSASRSQKFAEPEDVPHVPFDQAIKDFVARTPELARTAPEVLEVYARHGFTLVKATELEVVQKVQKFLKAALEQGTTENRATWVLESMGDWSRAYAETVYRNALGTAYSAGTFREMANPDVQAVIGGLKFRAVGDSDTRPNHLAAQGLIAAHDDPVWNECAPPCGHRCRCGLRFVDWLECRALGLVTKAGRLRRATVPRGFYRDPGFGGGRPDLTIYG